MKNPKIALVGQPNAGKSTVFNVLSDLKTTSSNFSGTSVEIAQSFISIHGHTFHLVDLPGVYSLNPGDEAEKVTYQFLTTEKIDLLINVVDASMLSRSLELTVELMEFGIPIVIALNMWDEAERRGLKIYPGKLEKLLNIPVVTTAAIQGKGIRELLDACHEVVDGKRLEPVHLEYTSHIEDSVQGLETDVGLFKINQNGTPRFYAIKAIENPGLVPEDVLNVLAQKLEQIHEGIRKLHRHDSHETISSERHHLAMKLMESVSHFIDRKTIPFRERLDRYLLHPFLGYLPLLVFFLLFFGMIYYVGRVLSEGMSILLDMLPGLYAPFKTSQPFWWYSIDGVYQGLSGALGIVLPYFLPLVFLTSIFEDTGYLARIAFLMDGFMHKIGLHGKSVAPFVLGFGCTVPALYGIRILENQRERFLTAVLLPFIPCTARTSIILALTAAFTGPLWTIFVYGFVVLVIGITGRLISVFMEKPMGLVMEIPDLKIPSLRISFSKTWLRVKGFLKFATLFLILGSIVMGWLEYAQVNHHIDRVLSPLLSGVMGLPDALGSTLVYGFFRKELVLVMATSAFGVHDISCLPLSPEQVVVFIIFVTLYFPCLSTFVAMWKEFGKKIALVSAGLSVVVATVAAFILKIFLL